MQLLKDEVYKIRNIPDLLFAPRIVPNIFSKIEGSDTEDQRILKGIK
jgi:hypothetical protein